MTRPGGVLSEPADSTSQASVPCSFSSSSESPSSSEVVVLVVVDLVAVLVTVGHVVAVTVGVLVLLAALVRPHPTHRAGRFRRSRAAQGVAWLTICAYRFGWSELTTWA